MDPIFFKPLMIERVWGGNRLPRIFGKEIPAEKIIGESWELSDRAEAQSVAAGGPFEGRTLRSLLEEYPREIMGGLRHAPRFPLLLKYVDAGSALSVQVHPDDAGARAFNDSGKTECWVVVHTEPGAQIVRGLKPGVTREQCVSALAENRLEELLHSFEPKVGDVIALPPGMVHAIGSGLVVAEIQQNSDLTFRLYDYNRPGLDGKPRKLHIAEALDAIRFADPGDEFDGDMREDIVFPQAIFVQENGVQVEVLLRGKYFGLQRVTFPAGGKWGPGPGKEMPATVMVLSGSGAMNGREIRAGMTGLIPASASDLVFTTDDNMTLLWSRPN